MDKWIDNIGKFMIDSVTVNIGGVETKYKVCKNCGKQWELIFDEEHEKLKRMLKNYEREPDLNMCYDCDTMHTTEKGKGYESMIGIVTGTGMMTGTETVTGIVTGTETETNFRLPIPNEKEFMSKNYQLCKQCGKSFEIGNKKKDKLMREIKERFGDLELCDECNMKITI